jgi:hypothetical protein
MRAMIAGDVNVTIRRLLAKLTPGWNIRGRRLV